jgi:hypothetical protein
MYRRAHSSRACREACAPDGKSRGVVLERWQAGRVRGSIWGRKELWELPPEPKCSQPERALGGRQSARGGHRCGMPSAPASSHSASTPVEQSNSRTASSGALYRPFQTLPLATRKHPVPTSLLSRAFMER